MGCILSFFRTLTSYHGSHLSQKQVQRQRQQRLQKLKSMPDRESPPSPTDSEGERLPCTPEQHRQFYKPYPDRNEMRKGP
ncbi:Uncharacterised protein r2_g1920 [Pycnogonum litorale]